MQAVLGLPAAIVEACCHPQWQAVGEGLAVRKGKRQANPMRELDCREVLTTKRRPVERGIGGQHTYRARSG